MKIIRASHLGMCFGVRDAIALASHEAKAEPVTILGDLVHNEAVLKTLRHQGVRIERQVADISTQKVIITAHGASQRTLSKAREHGLHVLEATCPLVHVAHRAMTGLVAEGYYPVVIGRRDHVEVRGITEDLAAFSVILNEADVAAMPSHPRFGVIAQTTQPIERVLRLVESVRSRFTDSEVRFVDTVCQPTKQRQLAALDLARQCSVVLVIGGLHSNNTQELVATCRRHCERVFHLQSAEDLRATWFTAEDTVGITAGTSTPDDIIQGIESWLQEFTTFQEKLAAQVSEVLSPAATTS